MFFRKTNMVPKYRSARDSGVASATGKSNLQMLHDLRFECPKKLLCGYLNINSLRNKRHDLRLIIYDVSLDYFVISETKLDNSFPNAQLTIINHEISARRDRDKRGVGLIEFVRKGLICKSLRKYESLNMEVICSEVTISNKNWVIFSMYRPPHYSNLLVFFKELGKYLNQACENYDNFIVMGDFNIDIRETSPESHKLDEFCSLFSLTNIIKSDTCFTKFHSSTIDLFLTNKPNLFKKTNAIETGLSDHHKLICTFFKSCFGRFQPKIVYYRNYQKFNEADFLNDVKNSGFSLKTDDPNENYDFLTNTFINIVNKYAPLKKKFIRGNQAPFMTRNLGKKFIPEVDLEIYFVKTLQKKMKNCIKNKETNVLPLGGNV